mgnify:CR=1 FL=1
MGVSDTLRGRLTPGVKRPPSPNSHSSGATSARRVGDDGVEDRDVAAYEHSSAREEPVVPGGGSPWDSDGLPERSGR